MLSVNSVCWAPHELGLMLACASSDGSVSVLTYTAAHTWHAVKITNAHNVCLSFKRACIIFGNCTGHSSSVEISWGLHHLQEFHVSFTTIENFMSSFIIFLKYLGPFVIFGNFAGHI
jgi:hypothetical protein